jgi:hypothetical protein
MAENSTQTQISLPLILTQYKSNPLNVKLFRGFLIKVVPLTVKSYNQPDALPTKGVLSGKRNIQNL